MIIRYNAYTLDTSTRMLEMCFIGQSGQTEFRHVKLNTDEIESMTFTYELLEKYERLPRARRAIFQMFRNAFEAKNVKINA